MRLRLRLRLQVWRWRVARWARLRPPRRPRRRAALHLRRGAEAGARKSTDVNAPQPEALQLAGSSLLWPSQASDGGVRDHIFLGTPGVCVVRAYSTEYAMGVPPIVFSASYALTTHTSQHWHVKCPGKAKSRSHLHGHPVVQRASRRAMHRRSTSSERRRHSEYLAGVGSQIYLHSTRLLSPGRWRNCPRRRATISALPATDWAACSG